MRSISRSRCVLSTLVAAAGLACTANQAGAQIVIGTGSINCNPAWRVPYCGGTQVVTAPCIVQEESYNSYIAKFLWSATVDATYHGWTVEQYDTWGYCTLAGIGSARWKSNACGYKEDCIETDAFLDADADAQSLITDSVSASVVPYGPDYPILAPFFPYTAVYWGQLQYPESCDPRKVGSMYSGASLFGYETYLYAEPCCKDSELEVHHRVSGFTTSLTVSKHTVRFTRCEEGTGVTGLDVDINTDLTVCSDLTGTWRAGMPTPRRQGYIGRVVWRIFTTGGTPLHSGSDFAAVVNAADGASARGGRLAGSFGSALDSMITSPPPDTSGSPVSASGVVTLSDSSIATYLDGVAANTTLDMEVEVMIGGFTQSGDNNNDGSTNWDDRVAHTAAWGLTHADAGYDPSMDWNVDGTIDSTDYIGLDEAWRRHAGCPADCGSAGGFAGSDGVVDNNDNIRFITEYMGNMMSADIGQAGGFPGADGVLDNNDLIVFYNWYFGPCI